MAVRRRSEALAEEVPAPKQLPARSNSSGMMPVMLVR